MQSEVQFDFEEEQRPEYKRSSSKLSGLIVKWSGGRVDETQANYVLLGFVVLAIVVSIFFSFYGSSPKQASPDELRSYGKIQ